MSALGPITKNLLHVALGTSGSVAVFVFKQDNALVNDLASGLLMFVRISCTRFAIVVHHSDRELDSQNSDVPCRPIR